MRSRPSVALLGPQREQATAGRILAELGVRGRIALVTAGWQEREAEDQALVAALGLPATNLALHARSQQVFTADPTLRAAYQERQERLRHLQDLYRIRLDYDDDAARAISVRHVEPELLAEEAMVSIEHFRQLDRDHVDRCRAIHAAFEEKNRVGERAAVRRQREELRAILHDAAALVIAGGHVASLLNRMQLFDVIALAAKKPIVAWSAGAMVLTDRIVLFHDYPPYGKDIAQVLEAGFGLAPGIVAMPDPQRRIRLDDRAGIARFAQRMAPASCVALDEGSHVIFERGHLTRAEAMRLTQTGAVLHMSVAPTAKGGAA